jgi:hypothetical protein
MSNVFLMYLFKSSNNLEEEVSRPLFLPSNLIIVIHCHQEVEKVLSIWERISLIYEGLVNWKLNVYLNDMSILTYLIYLAVLIHDLHSPFQVYILLYHQILLHIFLEIA